MTLPILLFLESEAQNPNRFKEELTPYFNETPGQIISLSHQILFTGSSSIRMWENAGGYFLQYKIPNRGFGGSEMSDLLFYSEVLVTKYKPTKVFIYEGDNDIAHGDKPQKILSEAKRLIAKIRIKLPGVPIVFISAKPSISRWHLTTMYNKFNSGLEKYCNENGLLSYVDTWNIMLNEDVSFKKNLFIDDGLHLNSKGYGLWAKVIASCLYLV